MNIEVNLQLHVRILLSLVLYVISSCSNYSDVKESLTGTTVEIPKLIKSTETVDVLKIKLVDISFSKEIMNKQAQFNKEKTFIFPALFYTDWHHITSYSSGYDTFSGDIVYEFQDFVTSVLSDYKIKFVENGEDVRISLKVNSFDSKLTYHKKGRFLMLIYYLSSTTNDYSTVDSQIEANLTIYTDGAEKVIPITSYYHAQNLNNLHSIEKVKLSLHHNLYDFSIKLLEELLNVQ